MLTEMAFGPIIVVGKGIYDKLTLPKKNAELTRILAIPALKNPHVKLKNRFVFVRSIREASLQQKLESVSTREERLHVTQQHFELMRKELEMNKQHLETQTATKADVAVLGLALQEVALCLDEHVDLFKKSGQNELDKFHTESQTTIAEQRAITKKIEEQSVEAIQCVRAELEKSQQERQRLQQELQTLHRENSVFKRNMLIGTAVVLLTLIFCFLFLR